MDLTASFEIIGEKFMVLSGVALNKIENFYFKSISKIEKSDQDQTKKLKMDMEIVIVKL